MPRTRRQAAQAVMFPQRRARTDGRAVLPAPVILLPGKVTIKGAPAARRWRDGASATLEYARHGRSIGGESPLEEEVVLTPSRRQLRRREAGWEGSPRRIPAPRYTNRVEGG